jgi:hypothetical protein
MNLILLHTAAKNPGEITIDQLLPPLFTPPHEVNEIDESPIPAIRLNDQPLIYTEGCIAAGCPEDLW